MIFFFKKGGTLEQGAITYSVNEFFSWVNVETCSGDPEEHQGTHKLSPGGGAGVAPSAPLLLSAHAQSQ